MRDSYILQLGMKYSYTMDVDTAKSKYRAIDPSIIWKVT